MCCCQHSSRPGTIPFMCLRIVPGWCMACERRIAIGTAAAWTAPASPTQRSRKSFEPAGARGGSGPKHFASLAIGCCDSGRRPYRCPWLITPIGTSGPRRICKHLAVANHHILNHLKLFQYTRTGIQTEGTTYRQTEHALIHIYRMNKTK